MSDTVTAPADNDTNGPVEDEVVDETPQEGDHDTDQTEASDDTDDDEVKAIKASAEKARREAKNLRQRLRETEAQAAANAQAAAELKALADASKTDAQRAQEKRDAEVANLRQQLEDMRLNSERMSIVAKYGLTEDEADDLLDGTDVERMERRASRYFEQKKAAAEKQRRAAQIVPAEGRSIPQPTGDPMRSLARSVFGSR